MLTSHELVANESLVNESLVNESLANQPSTPELPAISLLQLMTGMWVTQAIYVAASLGVADLLKSGAKSVDELAPAVKAQVPQLYRILRALASVGIFTEIAPRQFALSAMADYLRTDVPGSLRALSLTLSDSWQWNCFGDMLTTVKTGGSAMQRLYDVQDTFDYLTQCNPESGAIFDAAMTGWASSVHTAILDTYNFSNIHTLIDIAGGHGTLIAAILQSNPQMQGILFDLPSVVAGAKTLLERECVADRCTITGGNFFESVPQAGDAYLLSHILHDWSDTDCIRLLSNIRRSIAQNGKLVVVEMIIPSGNTHHFGKWLDIAMMTIFSGGRERTAAEYKHLFEAAGFCLTRIVPTSGFVSVIEGVCA